jgi:hypothetical protein
MRHTTRQTRENRTIAVDFQNEATYDQLLGDGKACVACVLALLFVLGFQLKYTATCQGCRCLICHARAAFGSRRERVYNVAHITRATRPTGLPGPLRSRATRRPQAARRRVV